MVGAVRRMASYTVVTGQAGGGGEDDKVAGFVVLLLLRGTEFQDSTRAYCCQTSYSLARCVSIM
jgi:hypothetical protein